MSKALSLLTHRGPDGEGSFFENSSGLMHKRLSIIDLAGGGEPIFSEDKRYVLVFNGEIYNYKEIRRELEKKGHVFSSNTDCEVIVHLAQDQSPASYINLLNGDFAFIIYDRFEKKFTVARDRFGIKPMYYCESSGGYIFSSEIKPLLLLRKQRQLDGTAVKTFITLRYCPTDSTLIEGIKKVPPAHYMIINGNSFNSYNYWTPKYEKTGCSFEDSAVFFRELFLDAVKIRLQSDVPVGLFLSGGIDSASVLGGVARSGAKLATYTVCFGSHIDELKKARELSRQFGVSNEAVSVERNAYLRLSEVVRTFDNPIGDVICLPTFLLAERAKKDVKVILTGEGADEYLGGYIHHKALLYGRKLKDLVPKKLIGIVPEFAFRSIMPYVEKPKSGLRDRIERFYEVEGLRDEYLVFSELFLPGESILTVQDNPLLNSAPGHLRGLSAITEMDRLNWLEAYTLNKQDGLLMANSVEGRVPFLDHRLYEFAAGVADNHMITPRKVKILLRRAMTGIVPHDNLSQKKQSFYLPAYRVFDADFEAYVRDTVSSARLAETGFFDPRRVDALLDDYFREPDLAREKKVMCLLIFCIWHMEIFRGRFI